MYKLTSIALALTASLTGLPIGSVSAEDDHSGPTASLKGTYRFTTVKTCTDSTIGSIVHFYFNGTIVYDGHGTAQLTQQGTVVRANQTPMSLEETAELTYSVKPNGTVRQEGTFQAADRSYTLALAKMTGQIDSQGSVLIFNTVIPLEKESVTVPGGEPSEYFCGFSSTAVRMR
ncbi:MAG: hypothetical protein CV090_05885 [Nitrospira sp. WS238]|nr:hypothetical protein [Nitrospira sp. WS238]